MHYDAQLVLETEGTLPAFAAMPAEVLLLGGSKSPAYLAGCGHLAPDNSGDPERAARELRSFFAS